MALSRRLRFEVLRRDGHACRYCGAMAPDVKLTVDHVVPVALGGSDEPRNLVTACVDCNNGKTSTQPDSEIVEDIAADALRWKRALEAAASNLLADREVVDGLLERFEQAWSVWKFEVTVTVPAVPAEPTGDVLIDNWWRLHTMVAAAFHARPVEFDRGTLKVQAERGWLTDVRRELNLVSTRRDLAEILGQEVTAIEIVPGWPGPIPRPPTATRRVEERSIALPVGWRGSIERFISLGLPEQEMQEDARRIIEADA